MYPLSACVGVGGSGWLHSTIAVPQCNLYQYPTRLLADILITLGPIGCIYVTWIICAFHAKVTPLKYHISSLILYEQPSHTHTHTDQHPIPLTWLGARSSSDQEETHKSNRKRSHNP